MGACCNCSHLKEAGQQWDVKKSGCTSMPIEGYTDWSHFSGPKDTGLLLVYSWGVPTCEVNFGKFHLVPGEAPLPSPEASSSKGCGMTDSSGRKWRIWIQPVLPPHRRILVGLLFGAERRPAGVCSLNWCLIGDPDWWELHSRDWADGLVLRGHLWLWMILVLSYNSAQHQEKASPSH